MKSPKKPKSVAILGCQGYGAQYGGFETLVQNLVDSKNRRSGYRYIIFNSSDKRSTSMELPASDLLITSQFRANGFQGLIFDFFSTIFALRKAEVLLFLGPVPMIFAPLLRFLLRSKAKILVNVGGLEWKRPNLGFLSRLMLWQAFKIACRRADHCIFDNQVFVDVAERNSIDCAAHSIIPYGCTVDQGLKLTDELLEEYPFLREDYCIAVGRSVPDNNIKELLDAFAEGSLVNLVVVSNFSASEYGKQLLGRPEINNVFCIDGCYHKPTLDFLRRNAVLYIHTHENCGTAPSLIEGAMACSKVCSIDVPQNRYSLGGQGFFFNEFFELVKFIDGGDYESAIVTLSDDDFSWDNIIASYEDIWA